MTRDQKQNLHNKAKRYNDLKEVFSRIIKGIDKVLSGCQDTIFESKSDNIYTGFGQTILFSWKFILVEDLAYGVLIVNHLQDNIPISFFTRYFDPKGNIYSTLEQESSEHYPENHAQMEDLLFLILEEFYKLDCFNIDSFSQPQNSPD